MMKRFFVACLISTLCIAKNEQPIVIISIHKCGTHLLGEAISLLTEKKIFWPGYVRGKELDETLSNIDDDRFMWIHVPYRADVVNIVAKHDPILFFIYRDPRDYVVSHAYFMLHWMQIDGTPNLDLDKTLSTLIDSFVAPWYADSTTFKGIAGLFDAMMGWHNYPGICAIRFEDLIGERGGGSAEKQWETIVCIATHLGIEPTDETIQYVVDNIFGNGVTFREGKIGSWRQHFTPQHVELCKKNAGQLLIDLGYETDLLWNLESR